MAGIVVECLFKKFGTTEALSGFDMEVAEGSVVGLLGPNGAGKTTAVRILATLARPDAGRATVGGHDVTVSPARVREIIGMAGQYASLDELLSGWENLYMIGRLRGLSRSLARSRAEELLGVMALLDVAQSTVKSYSGGMRRRLDLAASLVGDPPFIYLDEPTTGLDPASRLELWQIVSSLAKQGSTIVLTTQYLEEADRLADRIVVINKGRAVANGTATELKHRLGRQVIEARPAQQGDLEALGATLSRVTDNPVQLDTQQGLAMVRGASQADLARAATALAAAEIEVAELSLRLPSLDEAFLAITAPKEASEPPR